jgi:predicted transcriptional regulator
MELTKIAQQYLDGERLRVQSIREQDKKLWEKANTMMYQAVKDFQKMKESQEILFLEVERLDKIQ